MYPSQQVYPSHSLYPLQYCTTGTDQQEQQTGTDQQEQQSETGDDQPETGDDQPETGADQQKQQYETGNDQKQIFKKKLFNSKHTPPHINSHMWGHYTYCPSV